MRSGHTTTILLVIAALGLAIPWFFNIAYLLEGGSFSPEPFLAAVSANPLTAGITWDVYLAAAAFSVWLHGDAPLAGVRRRWMYIALTFGIGLGFALPLYLAMRGHGVQRR
jgi:hypothetical protein